MPPSITAITWCCQAIATRLPICARSAPTDCPTWSAKELARRGWLEVLAAAGLPAEPMSPWQVVRERRATFAALPHEEARRPPTRAAWRNLALAGDWTATGLPATIEGAIRSGNCAAHFLIRDTARDNA
jgi:uncharacterized protein with NAD-binding domain and iron-sulfur cluster